MPPAHCLLLLSGHWQLHWSNLQLIGHLDDWSRRFILLQIQKNVAAIATAVPPHTIYCEGLIQTWVTEVESIWLYTDLYIFLNSYLRKISKSSWLFSLFFSLPALLPLWQTSEVWFKLWPIALKYQNPLDWLIGPELACIATSRRGLLIHDNPVQSANPMPIQKMAQTVGPPRLARIGRLDFKKGWVLYP